VQEGDLSDKEESPETDIMDKYSTRGKRAYHKCGVVFVLAKPTW